VRSAVHARTVTEHQPDGNVQDSDVDTLTFRWTAPSGTFSTPNGRKHALHRVHQEGNVPITVTVDDGKGGTATQTFNVNVTRPRAAPIVQLNFEDVYFDFDRSSLRPEALRLLDDAIAKLQANPTRSMIIEGHTCNIGTPEVQPRARRARARAVSELPHVTRRVRESSRDSQLRRGTAEVTTTRAKKRAG